MNRVYAFTNENLTCLNRLYDFKNKKVLTVLGSGDQYFSSVLFGALETDVYDINPDTWAYFVLKFYSIIKFDYDKFFQYFVREECDNNSIFEEIKMYLPINVRKSIEDKVLNRNKKIGDNLLYSDIIEPKYDDGRFIPYLSKNGFYTLKELLKNRSLPKFYNESLVNLYEKLNGESYDILLTSNILFWLYNLPLEKEVKEYKEILEIFRCDSVQAMYGLGLTDDLMDIFINNGFIINEVQSGTRLLPDYVVSFRRKLC